MSDNGIPEVEATPVSVVRHEEETTAIQPPNLFGRGDPAEIVAKASAVAAALSDVIEKRELFTNISGRKYVRVEGWTLLGSMLGVFPVCVWTKQIDGGWEARVEARTLGGQLVGAAEASCLRSERNWRTRDDFALRSMAQTRATAKALRLPLGFVVSLAGYEATPAEEMTREEARGGDASDSARSAQGETAEGLASDRSPAARVGAPVAGAASTAPPTPSPRDQTDALNAMQRQIWDSHPECRKCGSIMVAHLTQEGKPYGMCMAWYDERAACVDDAGRDAVKAKYKGHDFIQLKKQPSAA